MYQCFDITNNTTCELNNIKRGSYIKVTVDLSDAWIDVSKGMYGLNVKLFQLQNAQCPPRLITAISTKPIKPSPKQSQKEETKHKTFVPNLEEIIKKKKQLTKLPSK